MLNVTVRGDKELVQRFKGMSADVHAALLATVTKNAINLQNHVVADKLQGQVLRHLSGALGDSIKFAVDDNGSSVFGRVFSNNTVKYAAIHEFGGTIPAHDVVPKSAQALSFMMGGERVFAKIAHIPDVQMPERSFLRSSLADMAAQITTDLQKAVVRACQGKRQ